MPSPATKISTQKAISASANAPRAAHYSDFEGREMVLAAIPGPTEKERLLVVLDASSGRVDLRQQSRGEGVDWFTQNSIPLMGDQLQALRQTLTAWSPRINGERTGASISSLVNAKRLAAPIARENRAYLRICTADSA